MAHDPAAHADDDLEALARRRFGNSLNEAERRLLRAAPKAPPELSVAVCGPNSQDNDPDNDPAKADDWGIERQIRAELIRWLCLDQEASKRVDPRGVQVYGAMIAGVLDLSFVTVPFPLYFDHCLMAGSELAYVKIPALVLDSSLIGPFNAIGAEVNGTVLLTFSTASEVLLVGARMGEFNCNGAHFKNPGGKALFADGVDVKGNVFLGDGFLAEGEVLLSGAKIGDDLSCDGGTFKNPRGVALFGNGSEVKGSVYLSKGFSAVGEVRLFEAKIGGSLECAGGKFGAFSLNRTEVKNAFFWHDVREASSTQLDLRNATVGVFEDDEASWPEREKGGLFLDGFVYERIYKSPTDAETRLRWLDRQQEFTPQPYRQLAKFLREMGDDDGAKQVLFELESRIRAAERKRLVHSRLRWAFHSGEAALYDATVGYGIYPGRAVWYLGGLTALGWIVHRRAQRVGAMAPTDKDAYAEFHASNGKTPVHFQPFSPLIYSVESCVPLVKLGQDERWQPDPNPTRRVPPVAGGKFGRVVDLVLDFAVRDWALTPVALRWFRWIMIGLGWLLATFFVAGLTGIIKVG
jgi:hypothetical protein